MTKYDYIQGFCKEHGYRGLWPVKYEGETGNYRKVCMACTCGNDKCMSSCEIIDNAIEVIHIENEWLLRDELM